MNHRSDNPGSAFSTRSFKAALALPSATFDAIKSMVVLADTRNLSETVRILGLTRQTIRRHIKLLEDIRKARLFTLEAGAYSLTEEGKAEYAAVRPVLDNMSRWGGGLASLSPALDLCSYQGPNGGYYYCQEYPITYMMQSGPEAIIRVYDAWVAARGELEAPAFQKVRHDVLVYREQFDSWLCVHVGDLSSLATWLGPVWAKSVIGSLLEQDPVANPSDELVLQAYRQAMDRGNCRYDHAAVKVSRGPEASAEAVNYQRLLLPCTFPDGSPALTVYSLRTNRIDLSLLGEIEFEMMPENFDMLSNG